MISLSQRRLNRGRGGLVLVLLALTALTLSAQRLTYAATLEVTHPGVEVRLANTERWLSLNEGAVMPFGPGDAVRTVEEGRAWLTFLDQAQLLLLSGARLDLEAFDEAGSRVRLSGIAIQQTAFDADLSFEIVADELTVTEPGRLLAIWSLPDQPDSVTVARGQARLTYAGESYPLQRGEGLQVRDDSVGVESFEGPWNAARLTSVLEGCQTRVDTVDGRGLLVRAGAGRGFARFWLLDDGEVVQAMATAYEGAWTRIQFLSGFGWVQSLGLAEGCTDLPTFSAENWLETSNYVINPREDEVDLLQPFFNSPLVNGWFYRYR